MNSLLVYHFRDRGQRAANGLLPRAGAPTHDRHGGLRRLAVLDQGVAPPRDLPYAHVENQRAGKLGQRVVVQAGGRFALAFLAGNQRDGGRVVVMRDGNLAIGGRG